MAKISRDDTSWHASGVKTRDARHTKSPEETGRHQSKKNTKKWCRGKIGKEHTGEWRDKGYCHILTCTKCGKHLDYKWRWGKK